MICYEINYLDLIMLPKNEYSSVTFPCNCIRSLSLSVVEIAVISFPSFEEKLRAIQLLFPWIAMFSVWIFQRINWGKWIYLSTVHSLLKHCLPIWCVYWHLVTLYQMLSRCSDLYFGKLLLIGAFCFFFFFFANNWIPVLVMREWEGTKFPVCDSHRGP